MKNLFTIVYISLIFSVPVLLISCDDETVDPTGTDSTSTTGSMRVVFENRASSNSIVLDDDITIDPNGAMKFENANGDIVTIKKLRYWVSNVVLTDSSGHEWAEPNSYHLIERTIDENGEIHVDEDFTMDSVPLGKYTKIKFSIGVDSAHNHAIDMIAGDLSTDIGMSWTWDTGYKFFVIEGRYLDSLEYVPYVFHAGTDANYKTIEMHIPSIAHHSRLLSSDEHHMDTAMSDGHVKVLSDSTINIHFINNVMGVFGSEHHTSSIVDLIELAAQDTTTSGTLNHGGPNTNVIVENYDEFMFILDHTHY